MTKNDYTNVIEVQNLSDGNFILRVENPGINFYPGQFFSLGISDMSINREYSVASSSKKEFIDFFIREVEGGSLTPNLRKLNRGDKIKILGDVNFNDVINKVKLITPVPGGVGPMTIACLMYNTVKASFLRNNHEFKEIIFDE